MVHYCIQGSSLTPKITVVRPLCRNGDKTSMSNYRLVSLLTTFSKGKVMHNRLSHYLQTNNISPRTVCLQEKNIH
jgi:hypothetical protein